MTHLKHYTPPNSQLWQGRTDSPPGSTFFQKIQYLNLNASIQCAAGHQAYGLLGFACDEGIRRNLGRPGASEGPEKIKLTLGKLPIHDSSFTCYDAGTITCENGDLEAAQVNLGKAVQLLISHQITPIVLGGGHELAWGHYQGLIKALPHEPIAIVNFDAHFDMRPLLPNQMGSSGTPFLQISAACEANKTPFDYLCIGIQPTGNTSSLFDTAAHHQVNYITAEALFLEPMTSHLACLEQFIQQHKHIYLSLCLDVFSAAIAPGVSAPQAMGLMPWQLIPLYRRLLASGRVISYDIAELSPPLDIDHHTAKLAAHFVYEVLHQRKPS